MAVSPASPLGADQNLLFGVLALQMDFVTRDQLVAAMNAWALEKIKPLGDILVEQGALSREHRSLLEPLVQAHIKQHAGDVHKSLGSLSSVSSIRAELGRIQDPVIQASLAQLGPMEADLPILPTRTLEQLEMPTGPQSRFRILRPHARGGLGEVFVAEDCELHREVALKEIQSRHADQMESRGRFMLEAEITGGLEHPGIVPVYGLGHYADGRPYYAMRFIKGDSLAEAIAHFHRGDQSKHDPGHRLMALRALLRRFIDVCNAIGYAHSRGVLHRDLKPSNIMLGHYGETLVVDWGLAKATGQAEETTGASEHPLRPRSDGGSGPTQMGRVIGTPAYMSPEQAAGRLDALGPASDIYSLGATLYQVLTGKPPVEGADAGEVLRKVERGWIVPPRKIDARLPKPLEAICLKAMSLQPAERYATPKELAEDIEHWLGDDPVGAWREPWNERLSRFFRRHRSLALAAGITLAVVSAVSLVAALLVNHARQREAQAFEINTLNRDIASSLEDKNWTAEKLGQLEAWIGRLARLEPNAADVARNRTNLTLAKAVATAFMTPSLDPEALARADAMLELVQARDPILAKTLRQERDSRVSQWETTLEVSAPFRNVASAFDLAKIRVDGKGLQATPTGANSVPVVPTLPAISGNVQLEATFDETWGSSPVIGIVMRLGNHDAYRFLVAVSHFTPRQLGGQPERLPSLSSARQSGEPVKILISRNQVILREIKTSVAEGPLRLQARRLGGRLSFQVNTLSPLVFDDPFPASAGASGIMELWWPDGVHLTRLAFGRLPLPAQPTSMERGDAMYAEGNLQEAYRFYSEQVRSAGDARMEPEGLYKQSLCALELGREAEAVEAFRNLLELWPSRDESKNRWLVLAACRLWSHLLDCGQSEEADKILNRLAGRASLAELLTWVPADSRVNILDRYTMSGAWWRVAYKKEGVIERLEQIIRARELLDDSDGRVVAEWRLLDAYRAAGNNEKALTWVRRLLDEQAMSRELRVAILRDYVWLLLERDQGALALQAIEDFSKSAKGAATSIPDLLLLERARVLAGLGRYPEADKELDAFFAGANQNSLPYADWADACLLRGFLWVDRGDESRARDAWRRGLLRNWKGKPPLAPSPQLRTGLAMRNYANAITFNTALSSLVGDLTEAEATMMFGSILSSTGVVDAIVRKVSTLAFPETLLRNVMLAAYRSDRGRDIARRMTYRRVGLEDFFTLPICLDFLAAFRIGALGEDIPTELDAMAWDATRKLIVYYDKGIIGDKDTIPLLKIWQGSFDPSNDWKAISSKFDADFRVQAAYLFGCRYMVLKKPRYADMFFAEVVASTAPGSILHNRAQQELNKLNRVPKNQ